MLLLSKIAAVLVTPLGLLLALGMLGLLMAGLGRRRIGLALVWLALGGLWIASMPLTARWSLAKLEGRYPAVTAAASPTADVAIVLGGAVRGPAAPRPGPDLGEAADRVLHAAELFKSGKVRIILVSAGNLPWGGATEPEAETIRSLLVSWGVPADRIVIEGRSRTTAENAREVKALWPGLGAGSALLVTSAAHMPRALATFRRAGLPVVPSPTDVRAVPQAFTLLDLLPDSDALDATSDVMKEVTGYLVYWLRGDL